MLPLFALLGNLVSLLHVSLPAFRVAGGILLFLQALTLTFSSPGLSSIRRENGRTPRSRAISRCFRSRFH
jgi:multiple antibiotic resistance protein